MIPPRHLPISLACSLALVLTGCDRGLPPETPAPSGSVESDLDSLLDSQRTPESVLADAFASQTSNLQVLVRGKVVEFLADDVEGDKHQRMIVELENGQTLLIAHNIDLATRVPESALDHIVYLYGEYEWNDEGGVVHWTHKDPDRSHVDGWIQWQGLRYE